MFMLGIPIKALNATKEGKKMPRTAPAVNGTPITKSVSLRYIDASGDKFADSYLFPAAITDLQIEAFADDMGAATNANLYEVVVQDNYSALPDVGDAVEAEKSSGFDVVNILYKNPAKLSHGLVIRAPVDEILLDSGSDNTDEIDPASVALGAAMNAFVTAINVGGGTFERVSGRFTERKEVNQKINF